MTPLGIVCGALGGWIVLAALIAPKLGRAIKHADPGEDHEPTPVPTLDETWHQLVPVDSLRDGDPLIAERFASIISHEWEWSE